MRRRRNEVTVEIRKTKRDDTLQKRRNVPLTEDTTDEEEGRENLSAASLDTIVERAMSPEPATQLAAVQVRYLVPTYPSASLFALGLGRLIHLISVPTTVTCHHLNLDP